LVCEDYVDVVCIFFYQLAPQFNLVKHHANFQIVLECVIWITQFWMQNNSYKPSELEKKILLSSVLWNLINNCASQIDL
jgi:hypothetical protein